jgi:hypothetical protein
MFLKPKIILNYLLRQFQSPLSFAMTSRITGIAVVTGAGKLLGISQLFHHKTNSFPKAAVSGVTPQSPSPPKALLALSLQI